MGNLVALGAKSNFFHLENVQCHILGFKRKIIHVQNQNFKDNCNVIKNNDFKGYNGKHNCKGNNY